MSTVPLAIGLVASTSVSEWMKKSMAAVPPNVTDIVPPRPVPVMNTVVPGGPPLGLTTVIAGLAGAG
jgi:hypothetical protein